HRATDGRGARFDKEVRNPSSDPANSPKLTISATRAIVRVVPTSNSTRYAASSDGKRFLISTAGDEESNTAPFHVVLNLETWAAVDLRPDVASSKTKRATGPSPRMRSGFSTHSAARPDR